MLTIKVPLPEKVSLNAIYGGLHWSKRKNLADLYHSYFIPFRKSRIDIFPVTLSFVFKFKGRLLDVSNCAYMVKLIEDALVVNGILPSDTVHHVSKIECSVEKSVADTVEITIK